jgi:hypothetical protein
MRRKLGRPRVDSEDVHIRLTRPALDTLDVWIASQPEPRPSRPEAIRRLLAGALGKPAAPSTEEEIAAERALLAIRRNARRMSAAEILRALIAICDAI